MASGDYQWIDLMRAMRAAGFEYNRGLINGFAVSAGEDSARDLTATYTNTDGSVDRGPWMFNSRWHPEVSDICAFNLECSTREARRVYLEQSNTFKAWSAYNNGRYKQFLDLGYAVYALDNTLRERDELKTRLASEQEKSANLQDQLDDANQRVSELEFQVASIQASLDAANQQVSDLRARAAVDAETIVQLQDNLAFEVSARQGVEGKLERLRGEVQAALELLDGDPAVQARDKLKGAL